MTPMFKTNYFPEKTKVLIVHRFISDVRNIISRTELYTTMTQRFRSNRIFEFMYRLYTKYILIFAFNNVVTVILILSYSVVIL